MFELSKHPVKILALKTKRQEKAGNDTAPSVEVDIEIKATNDMLIAFGPQLRQSLFTKSQTVGAIDEQLQVEGVAAEMPNLRNPEIKSALNIDFEGIGYSAQIHQGPNDKAFVELPDVKVSKVKVLPQEGGTVTMKLQLSAVVDPTKVTGKLHALLNQSRTLTLTPPPEDEQQRIDDERAAKEEEMAKETEAA